MPFHADENISAPNLQRRFGLNSTTLLVRDVFHTFQGEAPYSGVSAIFLRLGGCNRGAKKESCAKWLQCDTDFRMSKSKVMSVESIIEQIWSLTTPATELVVITGGEPLLQQQALIELCSNDHFKKSDKIKHPFSVQIETNGDVDIDPKLAKQCRIVCSPKAWENKNPWKSLKPSNFEHIAYFRHLVSADTNNVYHTIDEKIIDYCMKNEKTIYLSPITVYNTKANVADIDKGWAGSAINKEKTLENYAYSTIYATQLLQRGVYARLSSQSHLMYGIK
jgi:organic radical activating enzyme